MRWGCRTPWILVIFTLELLETELPPPLEINTFKPERIQSPLLFASTKSTWDWPKTTQYPAIDLVIPQRCIEHLLYANNYKLQGGPYSPEDQRA